MPNTGSCFSSSLVLFQSELGSDLNKLGQLMVELTDGWTGPSLELQFYTFLEICNASITAFGPIAATVGSTSVTFPLVSAASNSLIPAFLSLMIFGS